MRLRSWAVVMATAALFPLSSSVMAQDPVSSVSFNGIGFSFDRALGASVNVTQVPVQRPQSGVLSDTEAAHLAFTLYGQRSEDKKVPLAWEAPGVVRFYRTADLAGHDYASQQLEALSAMLSARPDLASRMAVPSDGNIEPLPFMLGAEAAQLIHARAQYVDTPELSGVAYLTALGQDISPFTADRFWYTFQGLSADGQWYIAADFTIEAPMFPATFSTKDADRISSSVKRYVKYLRESLVTLNSAAPTIFKPSLTSIDALVRSITFQDVPASGPAPVPLPVPSAAP